jgi:hypothetical protein
MRCSSTLPHCQSVGCIYTSRMPSTGVNERARTHSLSLPLPLPLSLSFRSLFPLSLSALSRGDVGGYASGALLSGVTSCESGLTSTRHASGLDVFAVAVNCCHGDGLWSCSITADRVALTACPSASGIAGEQHATAAHLDQHSMHVRFFQPSLRLLLLSSTSTTSLPFYLWLVLCIVGVASGTSDNRGRRLHSTLVCSCLIVCVWVCVWVCVVD